MGAGVRRILLVNVNTGDLSASHAFYRGLLGFETGATAVSERADHSGHGIAEPVTNECWFLYDSRGPRGATALQLISWTTPRTGGAAPTGRGHRGFVSLQVHVADPAGLRARVVELGGAVVGELQGGGLLVGDPEGGQIELLPQAGGPPRLSSARIRCADLDDSLRWYALLGLSATAPPRERGLLLGTDPVSVRTVRVSVPAGGFGLELTQWPGPEPARPWERALPDRGLARLACSVDDLAAVRQALHSAGRTCPEPVLAPLQGAPGVTVPVVYVRDPDGVPVELVERARPAR